MDSETTPCPTCGLDVRTSARFCTFCGKPITPRAPDLSPKLNVPRSAPVSFIYWSQPSDPPPVEETTSKQKGTALKPPEPFSLPVELPLVDFPLMSFVNDEPPLQKPLEEEAIIKPLPPTRKETELAGMVGAYSVIGGYTAAVIGLFGPGVMLLLFAFFGTTDFADGVFYFLVFVLLGAFIWVPISVILAVILGVGGLVLGLTTGLLAAILFRLTHRHTGLYKLTRVVVAVANAAAFGYAAYWLYTHSFFLEFFEELTAGPVIIGTIGALAGFVIALVDPEKTDQPTAMTAEESEEAKMVLVAPFALWSRVAGRLGRASADVAFGAHDAESISEEELKRQKKQQKEWDKQAQRSSKEWEWQQRQQARAAQEMRNQQKRFEEEQRRMAAQVRPLKPPQKK